MLSLTLLLLLLVVPLQPAPPGQVSRVLTANEHKKLLDLCAQYKDHRGHVIWARVMPHFPGWSKDQLQSKLYRAQRNRVQPAGTSAQTNATAGPSPRTVQAHVKREREQTPSPANEDMHKE